MKPTQKQPRFRGIRLPPEYQDILKDTVEQDEKDPEDQNEPAAQNRIKRYGGNFNG